jgi:hypothetical protein
MDTLVHNQIVTGKLIKLIALGKSNVKQLAEKVFKNQMTTRKDGNKSFKNAY